MAVAAATTQIMKLAWVTYLGALSSINAMLIPRISAYPPILAQCKVHRPWALFREGTVYIMHYCEHQSRMEGLPTDKINDSLGMQDRLDDTTMIMQRSHFIPDR